MLSLMWDTKSANKDQSIEELCEIKTIFSKYWGTWDWWAEVGQRENKNIIVHTLKWNKSETYK